MDEATFDIISRISNEHCNKTFGYLDKNDLKNEIFVICLEKLNDFDSSRGNLEHFLRVSVKNRLINRFKDITKSVRSPCPRCPFYDKGNSPSDCAKFGNDRHLCNKWRNYELSIESRNSLLNASEPQYERESNENILDKILGNELKDIVLSKIDKSYHYDVQQIMSGGKISKQRVKRLKREVAKILESIESKKSNKLVQLTSQGQEIKKVKKKTKGKKRRVQCQRQRKVNLKKIS